MAEAAHEADIAEASYDHDALAWAERQAELLRRLAAGEVVNAAVDWPHVIEEVRDVGLSESRACRSLLQQALVHLLELRAWPASASANQWRDKVGAFLDGAEDRFTPSMRQRVALEEHYAKAVRRAGMSVDASGAPRSLPLKCPVMLSELLAGDVTALVGEFESAHPPGPQPKI